jgi:hypothetical protein
MSEPNFETEGRTEVHTFVKACRSKPELLRHANAIWPLNAQSA